MSMEHLMTSEEVAEFLHVDPVTVRRLITKNELSAYRIGADYRIAPADLTNYLSRQRVVANAELDDPASMNSPIKQFNIWVRRRFQIGAGGDRFDRFTERARKSLNFAHEEAQRLQHNYIGTEHLLLGLLREGDGIAGQILSELDTGLDHTRTAVEHLIGRGDRPVAGQLGMTPRAKKVIELGVDEARQLNHHYIGTEHILLGLMREGGGVGAGILTARGVTFERVRELVLESLRRTSGLAPTSELSAEEPEHAEEVTSTPAEDASPASSEGQETEPTNDQQPEA